MTTNVLLVLSLACLVAPGVGARQSPSAGPELLPLVGLWRAGVEAGETTVTADGTAAPRLNEEQIRRYFGADATSFLASPTTPAIFPLAAATAVHGFAGGELRVEFRLLAGATDQTAGLAFNVRPDHSYLYARYNTKDGDVALWQYERGERTVLAHGELHEQLALGVWHTLTVRLDGRNATAAVNDRLRVTHGLDRDVTGGVGLWTKADSVTSFRRFSARPRSAPQG